MKPAAKPAPRNNDSVILITKQLRKDWVDAMAIDADLAPASFKIGAAIGTHFGNKSGMTYVSVKTLAKLTGLSEATVGRAILDLERRGYIIIQRREIGERVDGRKVYGGKGVANVYLPSVDTVQISATDRGQRLAARVRQAWEETQNGGTSKHVTGDVLNAAHSTSNTSVKHLPGDVPSLSSPSEKNSLRARGPSCPDGLGPAGALLRQRLGADVYGSWFGRAQVSAITADTLTLSAATKFQASRLRQDFETKILEAWQAITPTITRLEIIVRKETAE
jgi:biotin operon repressor